MCFSFIAYSTFDKKKEYKIIKIKSASEYYLDFDNDGIAQSDELVILTNIQPFSCDLSGKTNIFRKKGIIKNDCIELEKISQKKINEIFLNKKVKVEILSKDFPKIGRIYFENENISQIILKNGLGVLKENAYDFKENIKFENSVLISKIVEKKNFQPIKNIFVYKDGADPKRFIVGNICLFILDFTKHTKPDKNCTNYACKMLQSEIEKSENSVDIAVYNFHNQPIIEQALLNAQSRGVNVRIVTEGDNFEKYPADMEKLQQKFPNVKSDNLSKTRSHRTLMHNKFVIIDKKKVFTGSANITRTDLSGFNANNLVLINSLQAAKIYTEEFEQMYIEHRFHNDKSKWNNFDINIDKNNFLKIYFSPQDKIIDNIVIPLIDGAKNYVYIPIFIITHENLTKSLIRAKKRGVDVRLIIDATSGWNKYSAHKRLRANKIPVKAENFAGKMHMKTIIIDDRTTILGSMNFTRNGEDFNDENVLIIDSPVLASYYKKYFLYLWSVIPEKWLKRVPRAEGKDSLGSCTDGIDNNYDELIDAADAGCQN